MGRPKIFLKHQVPQTNEEWQRRIFFGAALCSIVPPKKLSHPLLPFHHQGTFIFTLCSKCCVEKHEDFCQHDDKEWALTGTWTTIEINKVVMLGYKLLDMKEVWHFEKHSNTLFSGFSNALYKGKLGASSYP